MSLRRVGLSNSLSTQAKIINKKITLSRVSLRRFPFPTAAAVVNYVEDVFSTYLINGTTGSQTITNRIDLSGDGGLVWLKARNGADSHYLIDSARGSSKYLLSNDTVAEGTNANLVSSLNADGFTLGTSGYASGTTAVSWSFRKAKKFFDIVTYTGNGVAGRTISHNLGSVPGCIIVKRTNDAKEWNVYHRSMTANGHLELDSTAAKITSAQAWNNTEPTSTVFTVGNDLAVNGNGSTYVAYLFAHDAGGFGATGSDNVISCGSLSSDGSGNASVTLNYEPQWILVKKTSNTGGWLLIDNMRGWANSTSGDPYLLANSSAAEDATYDLGNPTATGFTLANLEASQTFIYIAIRRGPMKTPTSGTSVYNAIARTGSGAATTISGFGFPVDLGIVGIRTNPITINGTTFDRLRGGSSSGAPRLFTSSTSGDWSDATSVTTLDVQDGFKVGGIDGSVNNSGKTYIDWVFRRAPGFFDVVCYTGTGADRTVTHNLGVVPELMIIKVRGSITDNWQVYCSALDVSGGDYLLLNDTAAKQTNGSTRFTAAPTSTEMKLATNGGVNGSGYTYVAYLFATLAGISKVGSYTGTGTTLSVDCGFTSGARFVLIKRTNSTGDWYVWDSARGIVAGNDPYLLLNSTAAEVTGTDYIDPYSPGFEISSTAPAAINANGGTYIFLAIA